MPRALLRKQNRDRENKLSKVVERWAYTVPEGKDPHQARIGGVSGLKMATVLILVPKMLNSYTTNTNIFAFPELTDFSRNRCIKNRFLAEKNAKKVPFSNKFRKGSNALECRVL